MSFQCLSTNSCFPLDPCVEDDHCFNGRWPCTLPDDLLFGRDRTLNSSFRQCESVLATGSIFYFTFNLTLFAAFILLIILYKAIPIICCWRFIPCLRPKSARSRGARGRKPNAQKPERARDSGIPVVDVGDVRSSKADVDLLESCPPAPLPNLREVYEHSKLSSILVSHDVEDGDGVVIETIHSRALFKERAEAVEIYRTCAILGMLLWLDPIARAKVEGMIGGGFSEGYRLISEGLKAATVPSRGKYCLDRAALLFEEIVKVITEQCFPWYEGAENWGVEGSQHKALDLYILQCVEIVNMDPPQRSCMDWLRGKPAKSLPSFPEMPMFSAGTKDGADKVEPSKTRAKSRAASMSSFARSPDIGQGATVDEESAGNKRQGLVAMASEVCMNSARNFDANLMSARKFTLAASSTMNMKAATSSSARRVGSSAMDLMASGSEGGQRLLSRLGRTVSRLQTERAMTNILASSPPAKMPDLDKLFQHAELCADMHDGVQITNLELRQHDTERADAVKMYRIAALFCKLLHLDPSALSKTVSDRIGAPLAEAQALMTEGLRSNTPAPRAVERLTRANSLLVEIVHVLTGPDGPFQGFVGAAEWTLESTEFVALDSYVHDCVMLFEDEPARTCLQRMWHRTPLFWRKMWQAFGVPDAMRSHPLFYIMYLIIWGLFVVRFFIFTCDIAPSILAGQLNVTVEEIGSVAAFQCLQTPGRTYLGVGPQYTAILGKGDPNADIAIPLLFGVMHSLLFVFGSIPVPMARGFWRDVSYWMPFMRKVLPIDDHIFLHKFFGYLALFCLFWGALIWVFVLGIQKCFFGTNKAACTGFDPVNIGIVEWFNPFINVVMLRVIVIFTWFFGITWMRYQNEPPKYWFFGLCCCRRLPTTFRQHWFEFAYILHVTIALATFILAEAARFQVFYPVMATWFLYIVDSWREVLFMTFHSNVEVARSVIHLDPQDNNRPTTMTVRMENPWRPNWRGGCIKQHPSQGAGMWVFVKIPSISAIEWHPLSLASAGGDDFVQLQIGIRPGVSMGKKADNWVLDESSQMSKITGQAVWVQKEAKTWTYKLYELLLNTPGDAKIPCQIRGPYGSSFRLCFNRNVKGALIMGAGTGLSAVESMLRAVLHRKEKGQFVPNHVSQT